MKALYVILLASTLVACTRVPSELREAFDEHRRMCAWEVSRTMVSMPPQKDENRSSLWRFCMAKNGWKLVKASEGWEWVRARTDAFLGAELDRTYEK